MWSLSIYNHVYVHMGKKWREMKKGRYNFHSILNVNIVCCQKHKHLSRLHLYNSTFLVVDIYDYAWLHMAIRGQNPYVISLFPGRYYTNTFRFRSFITSPPVLLPSVNPHGRVPNPIITQGFYFIISIRIMIIRFSDLSWAGYKYSFPFLAESCGVRVDSNMVTPLWKHLVSIENPTLVLVGIPFYVCAFSMFDLQVRHLVIVSSSRIQLS